MQTAALPRAAVRVERSASDAPRSSYAPVPEMPGTLPRSARQLAVQRLQEAANASPRARALVQLHGVLGAGARRGVPLRSAAIPRREADRTGLPDGVKTGIETLSGLSLDDVRVHRNSTRPSGVNALAYAQGTDIHLAPGEEKQLAHEAWHVVQQKQGRVRPTGHARGVPINDDVTLEREADTMGRRAADLRQGEQWTEQAGASSRPRSSRAEGSALQRKVGFEFEDGKWSAWEKTSLGTAMPPVARPVRRKAVLHRGTHFALEGDDTPGPARSNLEFVTDPFDTTAAGMTELVTALEEIGRITISHLGTHKGQPGPTAHARQVGPGSFVLYERGRYVEQADHQLGGGDVAASDILLSEGSTQGSFKMQATMGMSLESLPTVMRYFGRPQHESRGQRGRRAGARKLMRGRQYQGSNGIANVVGTSPALAKLVLARVRADPALTDAEQGALRANASRLTGLLSAMMMYMKMLQLPETGVVKYRIPFLGRSDFGSMFGVLPPGQQAVLRTHADLLAAHMVEVSNGAPLLGRYQGKDSDTNLTVNHPVVNAPRQRAAAAPPAVEAMASLTIGAWVRGITGGIDWLTPTNIQIWMDAMSAANVAPTTVEERREAAEMLESFASIGRLDVDAAGTPLAVMENRAIAPQGPRLHGNDINFFQAASMARDYLQFFINLSAHPLHPGAFPETPG